MVDVGRLRAGHAGQRGWHILRNEFPKRCGITSVVDAVGLDRCGDVSHIDFVLSELSLFSGAREVRYDDGRYDKYHGDGEEQDDASDEYEYPLGPAAFFRRGRQHRRVARRLP